MRTNKALVDTGIQVKRLLTEDWRSHHRDAVWQNVEPVTSFYSFMEFEERVFVVLDYLISVLEEAAYAYTPEAKVRDRLDEIIAALKDGQESTANPLIRLAIGYAKRILAESSQYDQDRSIDEVIDVLRSDRDSLADFGFRQYSVNGQPRMMRWVNAVDCRGGHRTQLGGANRSKSECREGRDTCNIATFLSGSTAKALLEDIAQGVVTVRDPQLRQSARVVLGAIRERTCVGRSIGRELCLSVAACVLVAMARDHTGGLVSDDPDRRTLAGHLTMQLWPL